MAKCRGMVHTHVTKPEDIQNVPCKVKAVKIFSNRIQPCAGLKFQFKNFPQGKYILYMYFVKWMDYMFICVLNGLSSCEPRILIKRFWFGLAGGRCHALNSNTKYKGVNLVL